MEKLILSVDDDRDVLDCLELILPSEGYSVITSLDPQNIFETITTYKPDLILLDIQMGPYNGLEVCRELKSSESFCDIPVLMLSSDERILEAMSRYKANGIIRKPFEITKLIETLDRYLTTNVIPLNKAS